ncbi:aldehyde dehydrogenase, partial [Micromonospora sp. PSH25]|nr:aldehyde dehydrogenase [Micromonospora foliorum]
MEPTPFFVASRPATGEGELAVHHPYDGRPVGRTTLATPDQVDAAVAAAAGVAAQAAALP